jgi:hypothetical protein
MDNIIVDVFLMFTFLDSSWQGKNAELNSNIYSLHLIWLFTQESNLIYCCCFHRSPMGLNSLHFLLTEEERESVSRTLWLEKQTEQMIITKISVEKNFTQHHQNHLT